jgi:hypothetical protein
MVTCIFRGREIDYDKAIEQLDILIREEGNHE